MTCLLYTSDAADERSSVDLGGRRIIKKKKKQQYIEYASDILKQTRIRAHTIVTETNYDIVNITTHDSDRKKLKEKH